MLNTYQYLGMYLGTYSANVFVRFPVNADKIGGTYATSLGSVTVTVTGTAVTFTPSSNAGIVMVLYLL